MALDVGGEAPERELQPLAPEVRLLHDDRGCERRNAVGPRGILARGARERGAAERDDGDPCRRDATERRDANER
jgi:hypothetical protein